MKSRRKHGNLHPYPKHKPATEPVAHQLSLEDNKPSCSTRSCPRKHSGASQHQALLANFPVIEPRQQQCSYCMIEQGNQRNCHTEAVPTTISGTSQPATVPVPISRSPSCSTELSNHASCPLLGPTENSGATNPVAIHAAIPPKSFLLPS